MNGIQLGEELCWAWYWLDNFPYGWERMYWMLNIFVQFREVSYHSDSHSIRLRDKKPRCTPSFGHCFLYDDPFFYVALHLFVTFFFESKWHLPCRGNSERILLGGAFIGVSLSSSEKTVLNFCIILFILSFTADSLVFFMVIGCHCEWWLLCLKNSPVIGWHNERLPRNSISWWNTSQHCPFLWKHVINVGRNL